MGNLSVVGDDDGLTVEFDGELVGNRLGVDVGLFVGESVTLFKYKIPDNFKFGSTAKAPAVNGELILVPLFLE